MYIAYDPVYAHPLPEGHRFPMAKYELIPGQLLHEGTIHPSELHIPKPINLEVILKTHASEYIDKLRTQNLSRQEQRAIGFPQSPELTHREWVITQGTLNGSLAALEEGIALNVAGGTHHAFADRGEGFCLLNDFAVAANELLSIGKVSKVLIIDLDVHQGNGTAHIFRDEPRVFTFSMHGAHNYPFRKETSDLDIGLQDGMEDEEYLALLQSHLPNLIQGQKPDFAYYLAGVDILKTDRYGKLNISPEGCKQRDEYVLNSLYRAGIPCCIAMGGGYSPDIRTITEAHCQTFRVARHIYG